jgi:hypothetical protein
MKKYLCLIAILFGVHAPLPAFADTIEWQSTAMTCVPTSTTIEQNKYVTTAGRIKFKPGESGLISFLCPVSKPMPTGDYTLRGKIKTPIPDLFGIDIALRRANNVSGAVETVLSVNSVQSGNITEGFRSADSSSKKITFDFEKFTYWVQISYKRDDSNSNSLAVLSVRLIRR